MTEDELIEELAEEAAIKLGHPADVETICAILPIIRRLQAQAWEKGRAFGKMAGMGVILTNPYAEQADALKKDGE